MKAVCYVMQNKFTSFFKVGIRVNRSVTATFSSILYIDLVGTMLKASTMELEEAFPGNRYVLNNRRIVGSGVSFAVCSEAT
jgi:hypothetical protein